MNWQALDAIGSILAGIATVVSAIVAVLVG